MKNYIKVMFVLAVILLVVNLIIAWKEKNTHSFIGWAGFTIVYIIAMLTSKENK